MTVFDVAAIAAVAVVAVALTVVAKAVHRLRMRFDTYIRLRR